MTKKRQKASEVWESKPAFLGKKTATFSEAFPEIKSMKVEVEQEGEGTTDWQKNPTQKYLFSTSNPPGPFVDCCNPLCFNGGLPLESILRLMVARSETDHNSVEPCQGYEGSPQGKKKYRECLNFFRVTIKLEFKD